GDRGVTNTADIIDLTAPKPAWRPTAPMHFRRESANAVLLLDGTVLVTGGRSDFSTSRRAEIFDPVTETWSVMAAAKAGRQYHSTSVLLPDGRVLSAGEDFGPYRETGELFAPPYLFKGVRPRITSAPALAHYGQSLAVSFADASHISRVALVRPGSVTHSVNFDQRYVDLSYSVNGSSITATAPASGRLAPPGWYMLTVLNEKAVPSEAAWVNLG
ncbi:MAG TPA: galactose oxidase-like domain-containing protein, partial [Actinomycetota bacterium]|nr:galactose oxidase-like domain-containing protein [Actinomycetota bacterium]